MILADTSVWIDHLDEQDPSLLLLLDEELVLGHPFVTGELAVARFRNREETLISLQDLEQATLADDREVVRFVTENKLELPGLSYIDAHLLASVRLTPGSYLWTRDKRLREVAVGLGVCAKHLR